MGRHRKPDDQPTTERYGAPGYLVDPGPVKGASEEEARKAREALARSTPDPIVRPDPRQAK